MIIKSFETEGIPIVVLKGTAVAMYYPEPMLRAMGDIDLLVPVDRYDEAKQIIINAGYRFHKEDYRNGTFTKNGVEIELHYQFSSIEKDIELIVTEGLYHAEHYNIGQSTFPALPTYVNGLVLLDHIRQHLVRAGLGLRQIIDWMMFVHTNLDDEAWENSFRPMAVGTGLETLAVNLTLMCKIFLGLPDPITWCNGGDPELAELVLKHLFIDGNFGRENASTDDVIKSMRLNGIFRWLQSAGLSNWKAAQKYPLLRPFAWAYQVGRYTRKAVVQMRQNKRFVRGISTGMEKADMLKKLGVG